MGFKLTGSILLIILLIFIVALLIRSSPQGNNSLIYSPAALLQTTWRAYANTNLEQGTSRTLDPARGYITTSEGESYTMLRAVWMADKPTFDASWSWTKDNLQHQKGDHLFSWLFGKRANGTYGVLTEQGGSNSASDADTDIALALLFGYARWQDHSYLGDARVIMNDIWTYDVVVINGTPYLAADDAEATSKSDSVLLNPSYFNPAAYHIFAQFDNAHDWDALIQSSFAVITKSSTASLSGSGAVGLPPDWVAISRTTGALRVPPDPQNDTHFGFDALRVPWRLALDWLWFQDPQALTTLRGFSFLDSQWRAQQKLAGVYAHNGAVTEMQETAAMYGGTIGYFMTQDPPAAKAIYQTKMASMFNAATNRWNEQLSYYDDNWIWFGVALYNGLLPNLTQGLPSAAFRQ
jgi:endo-1,4-beta-D-glucanase Y